MLFRKKDTSEGTKAKTSLFARRSARATAAVQEEEKSAEIGKPRTEASAEAPRESIAQVVAAGKVNPNILIRPRVTEKASHVAGGSVYVFDVAPHANKKSIMAAVRDVYNVTPVSVRTVTIASKVKTGRRGQVSLIGGGKKAYVQLKAGETIEIV
jgi:large subunit ribosomal protein L23